MFPVIPSSTSQFVILVRSCNLLIEPYACGAGGPYSFPCGARRPDPFRAVGVWYENFAQTTDEEVCELLRRAGTGMTAATEDDRGTAAMGPVALAHCARDS